MTRSVQEYIDRIINKEKQFTLNLKDQKLSGEMDLKEFISLVSIQAGGNEFTNLDWLFTLPEASQKKLKWLKRMGK